MESREPEKMNDYELYWDKIVADTTEMIQNGFFASCEDLMHYLFIKRKEYSKEENGEYASFCMGVLTEKLIVKNRDT